MSFSTVMSAVIEGLNVEPVYVEADISNGLPVFHMVGYLSSEVKEASERVRTAIRNSDIKLPAKRMVVNLAPATLRKRGASFDLPIALSVLTALGELDPKMLEKVMVAGELSLDGKVRGINGILPIVMEAKNRGCHTCILPEENAAEGSLVQGIKIISVGSLTETYQYLSGKKEWKEEHFTAAVPVYGERKAIDFRDIQGQSAVKRAVEVAVAGGHNLLMIGPPGSGKSMIAQRIPTILPSLTFEESMEITKIYSVMGLVDTKNPLLYERPFRSVHHTVTKSALIGGGMIPVPGEISLAHGGVLFLDELAEFKKPVLEVLRQPLEERIIRINRTHGNYQFPADFMLVAAMNPCPCGNYPDQTKCMCTPWQIQQYLGKISQPFLDRIDICTEAPKITYSEISHRKKQESSAEIRKRVAIVRKIQRERFAGTAIRTNAVMGIREIQKYCILGEKEEALMKQAFTTLGLTARTYHKILKVARTIADMDEQETIQLIHLKEAIGYRTMDKKYWGR